jgi:hypothetical protein
MGKLVETRKWVSLRRRKMGKKIRIWPLKEGTWKV